MIATRRKQTVIEIVADSTDPPTGAVPSALALRFCVVFFFL